MEVGAVERYATNPDPIDSSVLYDQDKILLIGLTHTSCSSVCEHYLGRAPESGYTSGGIMKLSWLKEFFSRCPNDAPI
jgi:hypothetical protein